MKEYKNDYLEKMEIIYTYFKNQDTDEQYYYGLEINAENVFDEWVKKAIEYNKTWQTDKLNLLISIIIQKIIF